MTDSRHQSRPETGANSGTGRENSCQPFLAALAARFSFSVFSGFFLVSFFRSSPFDMLISFSIVQGSWIISQPMLEATTRELNLSGAAHAEASHQKLDPGLPADPADPLLSQASRS